MTQESVVAYKTVLESRHMSLTNHGNPTFDRQIVWCSTYQSFRNDHFKKKLYKLVSCKCKMIVFKQVNFNKVPTILGTKESLDFVFILGVEMQLGVNPC